jgi:uncharacterized metal-binding protein
MNCTLCKTKDCQKGIDCCGNKEEVIEKYQHAATQDIISVASALVDNGRAGSLSRLEELIEFIKNSPYKKIGVAYCYGFEIHAHKLSEIFKTHKIKHVMVRCTTNGIKESEISKGKKNNSVSCNPIGQAIQLKKAKVDLVVEVALCLGHDILLHREIDCDFTVLVVKDRKFGHCPLRGFDAIGNGQNEIH